MDIERKYFVILKVEQFFNKDIEELRDKRKNILVLIKCMMGRRPQGIPYNSIQIEGWEDRIPKNLDEAWIRIKAHSRMIIEASECADYCFNFMKRSGVFNYMKERYDRDYYKIIYNALLN